jgi:hypothetical protein
MAKRLMKVMVVMRRRRLMKARSSPVTMPP